MQGIEIPIGAPLGKLDKDLKGANDKLKKFANDATVVSNQLGNNVAKGANQAGFALTNLGRVAQDAPFGFIGIQNNLNPLLESFQRLKSETGSTGGALKALGQSLVGPAGLGFALSVVSAGILIYQQYQQRANKETQNAKKTSEDYVSTLTQLNQVQLKGSQNAQEELVALQSLFSVYQDSTVPLSKRKDAYKEIQDLYPAYFGNLEFEEKATKKTKDAYDLLTTSILETARARAAQELIVKNQTKRLEIEDKLIKAENDRIKLLDKKVKLEKDANDQIRVSTREGAGISQLVQANSVQGSINNNLKNQRDLKNEIKQIDQDNLRLTESITASVQKGADLTKDDKIKKATQTKKDFERDPQFVAKRSLNELDLFVEAYRKTEAKLNKTPLIPIDANLNNLKTLKTGLTDWQLYVNNELLPKIQGNFETFFNNILMNGKFSFDALGKAILNTFLSIIASDAARQLTNLFKFNTGQQYTDSQKQGGGGLLGGIVKGIGGLFGKKALAGGVATAGGGTAAAGGVAATGGALLPILAGAAAVAGIASLFSKKRTVTTPQQSNTISTSAASSFSDFSGGRVVFEISGTNLIGVLNKAGAKLQRYG